MSFRDTNSILETNAPPPVQQEIDPMKLDRYISQLQGMVQQIPSEYRKMLPYDVICQLAHTLLDGTVIEITKGLREIQTITEKNLWTRRQKLIIEHRTQKKEILKRNNEELATMQTKSRQITIVEKRHAEKLKVFQEKCESEMFSLEQQLILDLDQQVHDQQSTLERTGIPLLFITNNPEEMRLQMYLMQFIMALID